MAISTLRLNVAANTSRALADFNKFSRSLDNKFLVSGLKLDVVRSALSQINRDFTRAIGEQGLASASSLRAAQNQAALLTQTFKGFSAASAMAITTDIGTALNNVAVKAGGTMKDVQRTLSATPFISTRIGDDLRDRLTKGMMEFNKNMRRAGLGDNFGGTAQQFLMGRATGMQLIESGDPMAAFLGSEIVKRAGGEGYVFDPAERSRIMADIVGDKKISEQLELMSKRTYGFRIILEDLNTYLFNPEAGVFGALRKVMDSAGNPTTMFDEVEKLTESVFGKDGMFAKLVKAIRSVFGNYDPMRPFIDGIQLMQRVFERIGDYFQTSGFQRIVEVAKDVFDGVSKVFKGLYEQIGSGNFSASQITEGITDFNEAIREYVKSLGRTIRGEDVSKQGEFTGTVLGTLVEEIGKTSIVLVKELFATFIDKVPEIATKVLPALNEGINKMLTEVFGNELAGKVLKFILGFVPGPIGAVARASAFGDISGGGGNVLSMIGMGAAAAITPASLLFARRKTREVGRYLNQYTIPFRSGLNLISWPFGGNRPGPGGGNPPGSGWSWPFGRGPGPSGGGGWSWPFGRGPGPSGGGGWSWPFGGGSNQGPGGSWNWPRMPNFGGWSWPFGGGSNQGPGGSWNWPRMPNFGGWSWPFSRSNAGSGSTAQPGVGQQQGFPNWGQQRYNFSRTSQQFSGPTIDLSRMAGGGYGINYPSVNSGFGWERHNFATNLSQLPGQVIDITPIDTSYSRDFNQAENRSRREGIRRNLRRLGKGALIAGGVAGIAGILGAGSAQASQAFNPVTGMPIEQKKPTTGAGAAWGAVGAGALAGAEIGQNFGPWGTAIGTVIGGALPLLDKGVREALGKSIGEFFNNIKKFFGDLGNSISQSWGNFTNWVGESLSWAGNALKDALKWAVNGIIGGLNMVLSNMTLLPRTMTQAIKGLVESIKAPFPGKETALKALGGIESFFSPQIPTFYAGKNLGSALETEARMSGRRPMVVNDGEFVIPKDGFPILAGLVGQNLRSTGVIGSANNNTPTQVNVSLSLTTHSVVANADELVETMREPVYKIISDAIKEVENSRISRTATA